MEYIPEVGLLVYDFWWALFIILLSAYIFWLWPELGLAILIFKPQILYHTEFAKGFLGHHLYLDYFLMIVLLARLWFIHIRQQEYDRRLFQNPFVKYSFLLTGLILLYKLWEQRDWNAFLLVFRHIETYIIPVFGILILSRDKKKLSRLIACAFGYLSLLQIAFVIKVLPAIVGNALVISRFSPIYGIPIWYSGSEAAILLALGYWLVPPRGKTIQVFYSVVIVAGALCAILGQSRGMWIAILVTSGFMLIYSGRLSRLLSAVTILGGVLLLVSYLAFPGALDNVQSVILEVFGMRYQDTLGPNPLSGRLQFWRNAWHAFLRSPVWGVGYYRAAGTVTVGNRVIPKGVHNFFLETLSEEGLIGFFLLLAVLFHMAAALRENWRVSSQSPEVYRWQLLAAAFVVYALASFNVCYWAVALAMAANQWHAESRECMALPTDILAGTYPNCRTGRAADERV